jgi:CheY-like chemotaxis protein
MKEIFFVHDDQEGPHARQSFLEMAGYEVTLMKSADTCLVMLRERVPRLLLVDVLIEDRTGFELTKQVRVQHDARKLPIILCSQIYRSRVFREEALTVGANSYMLHPIKLDDLVQEVNRLTVDEDASSAAA